MFGFLKRTLNGQEMMHTPQNLLDVPLLYFDQYDPLTVANACEGTHVFGGIGSGKTSGSGKALAHAFLNAGMGGLVLTAKPDELATWQRYAEETGRSDDLLIFSPDHSHRFNFLNYESNRTGAGGGQTENIVALFMSVLEASNRDGGNSGGDKFWQDATKQLLRNAVDLLRLSQSDIVLSDIVKIINEAPKGAEDIFLNKNPQKSNPRFAQTIVGQKIEIIQNRKNNGELSPVDNNDFQQTFDYWIKNFPYIADRTRSSITATFLAMADMFLRGHLSQLFCTNTTLTPDITFDPNNKIIVVALPVKQWGQVGIVAQVLFKFMWQQAIERRQVEPHTLPSFLWADEAHLFITEYDQEFLTTARSSRACMVYLTQNMPNYLAMLGGRDAQSRVDSLLGNFQTKIFHQNADSVTNTWAAELIGRNLQQRANYSTSHNSGNNSGGSESDQGGSSSSGNNEGSSSSSGISEQVDYDIMPVEFSRLRKGSSVNNCLVDAIIHQGGRFWEQTGKSYLFTTFDQNA